MTMDVITSGGDKICSYLELSNKPSKRDVAISSLNLYIFRVTKVKRYS
jgi:hypothetical protein